MMPDSPSPAVVFAETYTGRIVCWDADNGVRPLFDVGGGPNAVRFGPDGALYFTQNGGQAGPWRSERQRPPALQRIVAGSDVVQTVATAAGGAPFLAPHDLAFGPDGTAYMTDSGAWDPERKLDPGRVVTVTPDGVSRVLVETGPTFPSGIAVDDDATVYWCECYTNRIMRMPRGGAPTVVCTLPEEQLPESLLLGPDETIWIAGLFAGGIVVLDRDGNQLDLIKTGGLPLNCTLVGDTCYVTDLGDYDDDRPDDEAQMVGRLLAVDL